jgi:hypothetical protein
MKFNKGDHLQETGTKYHGIVKDFNYDVTNSNDVNWYLIENDELNLVNHWVPEYKLELHKQPLREQKLEQLGIK